jgi:proline iminopeptidase
MNNKVLPAISSVILFLTLTLLSCSDTEIESETRGEEGYKSINETEIFYKRMGSGEPIIMVHGGPMLEHGYLDPHFKPLTDDYELIYLDQRLSGRSAAQVDSSDVRLSNFVNDIEELRKALTLTSTIFIWQDIPGAAYLP